MAQSHTYLFVYGTLRPDRSPTAVRDVVGGLRAVGDATLRGRLYGLGEYPGLLLDDHADLVHGHLLELAPQDVSAVWMRLDAYEGFVPSEPSRSLFRREKCTAQCHGTPVECWVYVYNGGVDETRRIASGVWNPQTRSDEVTTPRSTRRPIIGMTLGQSDSQPTRYELPMDYATSIERAGGIPLAIPYRTDLSLVPDILDAVDGMLFTGGDDLDPAIYGETYHPKAVPVDPDRQRFELALLAEVERRRVPALGICLGSQLMNVHRGGSLIQFLPEHARENPLDHRKDAANPTRRHAVQIDPDSLLGQAIGKSKVMANSRHKQAVRNLGRGLRISARAPDGVVEAIEDPSMPLFLAVQWHPENLSTEPEHLAPFKLLVEKSRGA